MSFARVSDSQVLYLFVVVFIASVMNILKIAVTGTGHNSLVVEYSSLHFKLAYFAITFM